jgi:DNA-directed RNA polymerase alpha subunit
MAKTLIYCPRCNAEVGHFKSAVAPVNTFVHSADDILDRPADNMGWSVRVANGLRWACVKTVRDLVRLQRSELMQIPNFGRTSLREVEEVLAQFNLRLGMGIVDTRVTESHTEREAHRAAIER